MKIRDAKCMGKYGLIEAIKTRPGWSDMRRPGMCIKTEMEKRSGILGFMSIGIIPMKNCTAAIWEKMKGSSLLP